jgi:hypothetical protein
MDEFSLGPIARLPNFAILTNFGNPWAEYSIETANELRDVWIRRLNDEIFWVSEQKNGVITAKPSKSSASDHVLLSFETILNEEFAWFIRFMEPLYVYITLSVKFSENLKRGNPETSERVSSILNYFENIQYRKTRTLRAVEHDRFVLTYVYIRKPVDPDFDPKLNIDPPPEFTAQQSELWGPLKRTGHVPSEK